MDSSPLIKRIFYLWWKIIRWGVVVGIILWFFILPLLPIYGLIRPWPAARERLQAEGVLGTPLLIGASEESGQGLDTPWYREQQQIYLVWPDSFQRFQVWIFSETESGHPSALSQELETMSLLPLMIIWCLAGWFTVWQIRRWCRGKSAH